MKEKIIRLKKKTEKERLLKIKLDNLKLNVRKLDHLVRSFQETFFGLENV